MDVVGAEHKEIGAMEGTRGGTGSLYEILLLPSQCL